MGAKKSKRFTTRIFLLATFFIFLISGTFTAIFVLHEARGLDQSQRRDGTLLARTLAHSVRLGVLSENSDLIEDPLNGIMANTGVVAAAVFTANGKLLKAENSSWPSSLVRLTPDEVLAKITLLEKEPLLVSRQGDSVEIWAPVQVATFGTEEDALYGYRGHADRKIIGAVGITVGDGEFRRRVINLVLQSVATACVFLAVGLAALYVVLKRITDPLNRLIHSVHAFGRGEKFIPVETVVEDELANLAGAFNKMADSLQKRESEKSLLEERLRQAAKLEAIGTLAGGIAHDFNNILTAMVGFLNIMKKTRDPEVSAQYVDKLYSTVGRAVSLTKRLLAFSRKQNIKPVPCELNSAIGEVEDLLGSMMGERVAVVKELSPEPLWVMADMGQIDQVLLNIAANARDVMPEGGTFRIVTSSVDLSSSSFSGYDRRQAGKYALIEMHDSGPGIAEEIRKRIFDPFFTTKDVGQGTGLGLSVSYGIIQQHNGFIRAESTERGSVFRVFLPLLKEAPGERGATERRGIVLIADDDDVAREYAARTVASAGYMPVVAADAGEAVARFMENRERLTAVLISVIMRGGQQAYEEMQRSRGVPTIFIGGYRNGSREEAETDDEDRYVMKPLRAESLLAKLRSTIS